LQPSDGSRDQKRNDTSKTMKNQAVAQMVTHIAARWNDLFIYKEVTLKLYSTKLKYRTRRKIYLITQWQNQHRSSPTKALLNIGVVWQITHKHFLSRGNIKF